MIPYEYKNLPIPGGGYVTGFLFSKKQEGTLYLRTDIGGIYRYNPDKQSWKSLSTHVTMFDLSETYPIAIALDEHHPDRLLAISGTDGNPKGVLAVSEDRGETFSYHSVPTPVHGNWNGRGTGYRLVQDTSRQDTFYYASQKGGLLRTSDLGESWEVLPVAGEEQMTLVWVSPDGNTVVAGTAGLANQKGHVRGHSLYVSYDRGASFAPLSMPESVDIPDSKLAGLVAQRIDCDGTFLYVTCAVTGRRSYVVENGYSCDSGDTIAGCVLRYPLEKSGRLGDYTEITPNASNTTPCGAELTAKGCMPEYGFSGITTCPALPGMVACSTICKDDGDMIFLSFDNGNTWEVKLYDLSVGKMDFRAPYMRPCCNGGHNLIHWLSDLKYNPFCPDEIWFNSGTGVFVSRNFTDKTAVFSDCCKGLEETVHLNIYGLPAGDVQVIDILGDLGGFAFRSLDEPCDNSFADADGNRYITCINADFSDARPETVIVTPRGNWTGKTKGGLILSHDQCRSFRRLPMPYGLSDEIDTLLSRIEHPNVNSGWVALSPDCNNIVWSIADNSRLPINAVVYSHDGGETFSRVTVENADPDAACMKVYADRVNPSLMYGFGEHSRIYISTDGGAHFIKQQIPANFPDLDFGLIDCANKTEIRVESGKEGALFLALNTHGLYKMIYDPSTTSLTFQKITKDGDAAYRFGLGLLRNGGDYIAEDKAFYLCGIIDGHYGFHRSLDQGLSWEQLNDETQMFGDINSIDGDCRTFGRFYIATGSFGALYGEERS